MGRITVLIGCMFAQKTTELLRRVRRYKSIGYKVLIVNFAADQRYGKDCIASHDKDTEMAVCVEELFAVNQLVETGDYDVIAIDEGQFFPDIYDKVLPLVDIAKKRVYVCGLDGDFKRERFGRLLDLVPVCDSIVKLTANCYYCSRPAIFSHRKSDSKEQVLIGAADMYVPLCRACYLSQQ